MIVTLMSLPLCLRPVELEAPVNLTYTLLNGSKDDDGHTVKVTWVYPVPDHIQFGWISLDFELQYRHISEPTNWKVQWDICSDTTRQTEQKFNTLVPKQSHYTFTSRNLCHCCITIFRRQLK